MKSNGHLGHQLHENDIWLSYIQKDVKAVSFIYNYYTVSQHKSYFKDGMYNLRLLDLL